MEKSVFTETSLSDVRVIMTIIRVPMDSSTQVPAVRCAWAPVSMSYCARY
jgi:hypothetical protein